MNFLLLLCVLPRYTPTRKHNMDGRTATLGSEWTKNGNGKGKFHPRTGHVGPEGEYRYSSTVSLTSALDSGKWLTPCPGHFTTGNDRVPFIYEAVWAPGPTWTCAENSPPPGFDPRTVQPVAKLYPGPHKILLPVCAWKTCRNNTVRSPDPTPRTMSAVLPPR
jgi:hypothetical protein